MADKSVGLIELSSIAAGFQVADTMLKAGNVRLILSRSICSGKYLVLIGGAAAAVTAAVEAGVEVAGGCLIDSFIIASLHPDVFVALGRTQPAEPSDGRLKSRRRWPGWRDANSMGRDHNGALAALR